MRILLFFVPIFLLIRTIKSQVGTPTPGLVKTAYCACVCCENEPEKCYRHPSIEEDYVCTTNDCTKDFCTKWSEAKCKTSCYCSKCKDKLPKSDHRCNLYQENEALCECKNYDDIVCDTDEDDPEVASAREKLRTQSECLISCYCKECTSDSPDLFKEECSKAKSDIEDCSCENTVCPTPEQLEQFRKLRGSSDEDLQKLSQNLADQANVEEISDAEVAAMNERLRPYIESGKAQPLTKFSLKRTKCQIQCYCDACRWNSAELEERCVELVKTRVETCPACPNNITCPDVEGLESNCKAYCFCLKCGEDPRMPESLKEKCKNVEKVPTEICPCDELVDCEVLNQLGNLMKNSQAAESSSEKGKAKPGKLKEKHKMWDEL